MSILPGCMESSFAKPWISCKVPFFLRFLHYLTVTVLYVSGSHNNSEVLIKSLLHVKQEGSILVIIAIYKSYTILLYL